MCVMYVCVVCLKCICEVCVETSMCEVCVNGGSLYTHDSAHQQDVDDGEDDLEQDGLVYDGVSGQHPGGAHQWVDYRHGAQARPAPEPKVESY